MPNRRSAKLQPSKFLYRFLNGFKFFNVGVHGMLVEIHFLGYRQDLGSLRAGDNRHAVGVGNDDVTGIDRDSVTDHWDICARKPVVAHRSGGNNAQSVDRKSYFCEIRHVADSAVNDPSGKTTRG